MIDEIFWGPGGREGWDALQLAKRQAKAARASEKEAERAIRSGRDADIARLRREGLTYAALSRKFGLCAPRVRQIVREAEVKQKREAARAKVALARRAKHDRREALR